MFYTNLRAVVLFLVFGLIGCQIFPVGQKSEVKAQAKSPSKPQVHTKKAPVKPQVHIKEEYQENDFDQEIDRAIDEIDQQEQEQSRLETLNMRELRKMLLEKRKNIALKEISSLASTSDSFLYSTYKAIKTSCKYAWFVLKYPILFSIVLTIFVAIAIAIDIWIIKLLPGGWGDQILTFLKNKFLGGGMVNVNAILPNINNNIVQNLHNNVIPEIVNDVAGKLNATIPGVLGKVNQGLIRAFDVVMDNVSDNIDQLVPSDGGCWCLNKQNAPVIMGFVSGALNKTAPDILDVVSDGLHGMKNEAVKIVSDGLNQKMVPSVVKIVSDVIHNVAKNGAGAETPGIGFSLSFGQRLKESLGGYKFFAQSMVDWIKGQASE